MTCDGKWKIEITNDAEKQLNRLDKVVRQRIRSFVNSRLAVASNPRALGRKMEGEDELWRFRVGDYRIIASIDDSRFVILLVRIGGRGQVYRKAF